MNTPRARALLLAGVLACSPLASVRAPAAPLYPQFTYERVLIPMRDGVNLSADIWRPVTPEGVKVPVILTLTPYHALYKALDRSESDLNMSVSGGWAARYVPRGYAYVLADVRGTYNSGGCWDYGGLREREDGYDIVEWLGGVNLDGVTPSPAAAWSNGSVAMIGASYDGTTANAAAVEDPPHLATIVPISAISRWWGYAYQQGARATYSGESADIDPPGDTPTDFMFAYGVIPPPADRTNNVPGWADRITPCARLEQTMHGYDLEPDYDDFWIERDYLRRASDVKVPVLVSHGLLDFNVKTWEGTAWFQALPGEKMMVLGQWPHALPVYSGWQSLLDRWFERWLYGVENGVEHEPAVRVQDSTGAFREQETWGTATTPFALGGAPETYIDDGVLTESEMVRGLTPERYVRVPVSGSSGIHIEGRPVLHLTVRADRPSTHLVAVLCDVGPDGVCDVVSRAFLNARYAFGLEQGADLAQNEWYTLPLEFIDKDHVVAADHHLELIIASSSITWVASDEARAVINVDPLNSRLELPLR